MCIRDREFEEELSAQVQNQNITSGPPVSSNGPPVSHPNTAVTVQQIQQEESEPEVQIGPEVPDEGLPNGWTMEQWQYYGQQYLDRKQ